MGEKPKYTRCSVSEHFTNNQKVKVVFTKKDGSERTMIGTLHPDHLPKKKEGEGEKTSSRKPQEHLFSVFDIENQGWRSFAFDNIKSIEGVKE